jgi:hypothetical protein
LDWTDVVPACAVAGERKGRSEIELSWVSNLAMSLSGEGALTGQRTSALVPRCLDINL